MKAIITLILVLFFGTISLAQDGKSTNAEKTTEKVMSFKSEVAGDEIMPAADQDKTIARLYRFRNSKVLKELTFTTKKNKAKLA